MHFQIGDRVELISTDGSCRGLEGAQGVVIRVSRRLVLAKLFSSSINKELVVSLVSERYKLVETKKEEEIERLDEYDDEW